MSNNSLESHTRIAMALMLPILLATGCSSSDPATPSPPNNNTDSLYLNSNLITVSEGENFIGSLRNTTSLNNVIDAATAESTEVHSQDTHVWHTGAQLDLVFNFQQEYSVEQIHFWNYNSESYDVDELEVTFVNSLGTQTGTFSLLPKTGNSGPIQSESFAVDPAVRASFAYVTIKGSNGESDFQNIGFTVEAP